MKTAFLSPRTGTLVITERTWSADGPVEKNFFIRQTDADYQQAIDWATSKGLL